jgi:hypothetical protein
VCVAVRGTRELELTSPVCISLCCCFGAAALASSVSVHMLQSGGCSADTETVWSLRRAQRCDEAFAEGQCNFTMTGVDLALGCSASQ